MKYSILPALFGIAAIASVPACATTANFDFATGSGGQFTNPGPYSISGTGSLDGVTVTAYAFGNTGTSGALKQATLGQYNGYGLGVCDTNESTLGADCSSPQHQVDNQSNVDFVLFVFGTPVNLTSLDILQYASCNSCSYKDMDMSYWTGTASTTSLSNLIGSNGTAGGSVPSGGTYDDCGGSSQPACNASGMTDTLGGTDVTYLLVSAAYSNPDSHYDFFKIQGINGYLTATPEPATFGLIGLSLAGLGLLRRKRKLN